MSTSIYDLANKAESRMDDFVFAERAAKVQQALTAEQVLPIKRAVQWGQQHTKLSGVFVQAFDENDVFHLDFTSKEYNRMYGLPSNIYNSLKLMEAKGLIKQVTPKSWVLGKLKQIAQPLTTLECINA